MLDTPEAWSLSAIDTAIERYIVADSEEKRATKKRRLDDMGLGPFLQKIYALLFEAFGINNPTRPQYVMLKPVLLRAALLAETVNFNDSPLEKGPTYIELMRQCCYVNSEFADLAKGRFIPEVSGMQLMLYGLLESANDDLAAYLNHMFSLETNFTWQSFEYSRLF